MDFKVYQAVNISNVKKLKREMKSILTRTKDITVFLYNEISPNLVHVVFKMNDEYVFGTRKGDMLNSLPFDHYINAFFHKKKSKVFIEDSFPPYIRMIEEYITNKSHIDLAKMSITKDNYKSLNSNIKGKINKLEYEFDDGDERLDFVSQSDFDNITIPDISIFYMLWKVDNRYISVRNTGSIKVDNSDEEFLIDFIGVISNAL